MIKSFLCHPGRDLDRKSKNRQKKYTKKNQNAVTRKRINKINIQEKFMSWKVSKYLIK